MEHYVLIEGTKGAIKIDMSDVKMTVKTEEGTEYYTVHDSVEADDERRRIYHGTEMDGAIQYGHPGKLPPLWLQEITRKEIAFFNSVLHGEEADAEYADLLNGKAARAAIATADAATLSLKEDRKVKISEITG